MSVRVRATKTFTAYRADTCQLITLTEGQEVDGDLAVFLATAETAVEVLDDPHDAIGAVYAAAAGAPQEPVDEPVGENPDGGDDSSGEGDEDSGTDSDPSAEPPAGPFDPGEHTVAEVQAYAKAHPDQRAAVLAAEREGKKRTSILAELA
jgi:hypothetical protein